MRTSTGVKILIGILITALIGVLIGGGIYLKMQHDLQEYYPHSTVNGFEVEGLLPDKAADLLIEKYSAPHITLREKGEDAISGSLDEFGYTINKDALKETLQNALDEKKNNVLSLMQMLIGGGHFTVSIPFSYDSEVLSSKVNAAALPAERKPSVDAEMKFDKKKSEYYIEPEFYGNEFDDAQLAQFVETNITNMVQNAQPGSDLTLDFPEEIYIDPQVTADDISLNNEVNLYNQYTHSKITYLFGSKKEVVDWSVISDWVTIDNGTIVLDEEAMYEYVINLAAKYNTRYYPREFQTSIGTTITIPGEWNTYGYTIDEDAEYSQFYADVHSNTAVEREPVYVQTTADGYETPIYYKRDGQDDLAGNYVEANLSMQHLWFYVDGDLVCESDFVSGDVSKNHETNTGVFPLPYKESPSVLSGDDGPNGYEVEVEYWMPFSDGQGLHDATWRGSFGGQIYMYGGSHGCINLPLNAAATIYSYIQPGMAIVIYK